MILFACVIFCNINNGTVTEGERDSKSGFMTHDLYLNNFTNYILLFHFIRNIVRGHALH